MILLTSRQDKPIVLDEREIGAIVEYGDYSIIYMKHADHEIVVAESSEEIAAKMVEMQRKNKRMMEEQFKTTTTGTWPPTPSSPSVTWTIPDPGTEYGDES